MILQDESLILIRKYHFDYAPVNTNNDRKSVYHLQYGGELTPKLDELEVDIEALHPYLSPPRLESGPVNLAIVLDTIFCELYSIDTERIIEDNKWRDLVKSNEAILYKEYFRNLVTFFNGTHTSNFLYRDLRHG